MVLDRGLVFMSDTRTNAGLDNISTFKKMQTWENPGFPIYFYNPFARNNFI